MENKNLQLKPLPYVQKAIASELYIPIRFRDKVKTAVDDNNLDEKTEDSPLQKDDQSL